MYLKLSELRSLFAPLMLRQMTQDHIILLQKELLKKPQIRGMLISMTIYQIQKPITNKLVLKYGVKLGKDYSFSCWCWHWWNYIWCRKIFKRKNPNIKIWGIDTYGSVFKKYHETGVFDKNEIYPYSTEGIGEDIIPENVDFNIIDHFEKVTDKDAAIYTRKLAREEGIFAGNSCGAAVKG